MRFRKLIGLLAAAAAATACAFFALADNESRSPTGRHPARRRATSAGSMTRMPSATALAEMDCGTFRQTAAFAARRDGPENVYLWESARTVTGDVLPARDQRSVGSCVGFATASAIEHLSCVQIEEGEAAEYRDLAPEVIYGGSRVEVGGGRIRGDGSIGAWAAKWVRDYGVVPRGIHGKHDLRLYDENRCRDYGRRGVPDDLEPLAKEHPVRGVANVRSWEECRAAIQSGYPVLVCSSQGFTMDRDEEGFCNPRGRWYHAMAVIGVRGGDAAGRVPAELVGAGGASRPAIPRRCAGVRLLGGCRGARPDARAGRFVGVQPVRGVSGRSSSQGTGDRRQIGQTRRESSEPARQSADWLLFLILCLADH